MPTCEEEQHVVAAAQHILKALGATKDLSDDFRRLLMELDSHLSAMTMLTESMGGGFAAVEAQLKRAERKIMYWDSNPSLIWECGPLEVSEYLQSVSEIQSLIEGQGSMPEIENDKHNYLASRARCALHIAMSRLEEELYHILFQNKQQFEPQYVAFPSRGDNVVYDESFVSVEDEVAEEKSQSENNVRESIEYMVDLVNPRVIPDIKSIANVMFASNYGKEFCEACTGIRKDALEEYLTVLDIQKISIEEVLKLDWDRLNNEISKWIWAMKIIIRVYLAHEKRFCDQILGDFGYVSSFCFVEISKAPILCLLNLGEAMAMGPHRPEKLFRLLDMYEVLSDLLLHIDGLFVAEVGSFVRLEFHELLKRLGESARATSFKFGNAIESDASTHPFPGGGIHHLTRYVMNYIKALVGYSNTLNLLLKDQEVEDPSTVVEMHTGQDVPSSTFCPLACYLRSVAVTLESNLVVKSQLYSDNSLRHIFLMNNTHYMVQKVKGSELRLFFGDEWIRKHNAKLQQHATSYERATWSYVLSLLRDEKTTLKERCRKFIIAFEDVYKCQTRWCISDPHLREDLQISTSQKVIPAFRNFHAQLNSSNVRDKYIKYTSEDLETLLLDLFVGSARSLRSSRRR